MNQFIYGRLEDAEIKTCEFCLWGDQCPAEEICDHFDDITLNEYEDAELNCHKGTRDYISYQYEWETYINHWRGNDKWGDLYDIQ